MPKNIKLPTKLPVACHTKYIGIGSTFVAINGTKEDGTQYIPQALKRGAATIVVQEDAHLSKETKNLINKYGAELEIVSDARLALAQISAKASHYAHKKLKLIGITGTKGKTSTAFMLEHILKNSGHKTALISTVHNKILDKKIKAHLTTEQPDYLHQLFALCVEHNIEYVIMEVAAQALSLHRIAGLEFDAVIFTNFAHEHGEFYKNIEDYFEAKYKIFSKLKYKNKNNIFVNLDDPWGKKIVAQHKSFTSFGIKKKSHYMARIIDAKKPLYIEVSYDHKKANTSHNFTCPHIFGAFNSYNILAAVSVAHTLGVPIEQSAKYLKNFKGVPGRLELHKLKNGARCFIDYAHNPSSYKAVLSTLRSMTDTLILVFGAGGERDHEKRPIMGDIASQIADKIILTTDNPRSESPEQIIEDIYAGIDKKNTHKITKEPDRAAAIALACKTAPKGAIIAILGKGPDEYQIIGKTKSAFSEKAIIGEFSLS